MKRRGFIAATAGMLLSVERVRGATGPDDVSAVRQLVTDFFAVGFGIRDAAKFRTLVTEDFLLLEHGQRFDIQGTVALFPPPGAAYKRTDSFEFHATTIVGDIAYVVYNLKSDITSDKGVRKAEWLESAIARRSAADTRWRVALLHSTKVEKPAK